MIEKRTLIILKHLTLLIFAIVSCNSAPDRNYSSLGNDSVKDTWSPETEFFETDFYKSLLDSFPFERYMVTDYYSGKIAALDMSYYEHPKDVKDYILANYNQVRKPNFAGHYILFNWGCGSPCQMNAIVDAINGKTMATFSTSLGVDFRADSYLIIREPPLNRVYDKKERALFGNPEFDLFDHDQLVTLLKE